MKYANAEFATIPIEVAAGIQKLKIHLQLILQEVCPALPLVHTLVLRIALSLVVFLARIEDN